jgi:Ser/Thr protein kinase RdoA (MazF antagonist)
LALAQAAGKLIAELQQDASFPEFGDYRNFIGGLLSYLERACAPGLLSPHAEVLSRIREAYPWDTGQHVASHNDLNPGNVLFDGNRLWLIDWETSYRNDTITDVAIIAENFAKTPELQEALLRSWLGHAPDQALLARLTLMRRWTRLYYAGLLFATSIQPGSEAIADLSAPNPEDFRTLMGSGQFKIGAAETRMIFGKVMLAAFLDGTQTKEFDSALDAARA